MTDVSSLVKRINANPDRLHSESTPAAEALIEIGEPALPAVVPLLLSDHGETRRRALYVLELASMHLFGFERGKGWVDPHDEQAWRRFWQSMGDPAEAMSEQKRAGLAARWTSWLNDRPGGTA